MEKPFSEACERNKDVILNVLREVILQTDERLLEVGAGTGQHAEYLSSKFPASNGTRRTRTSFT